MALQIREHRPGEDPSAFLEAAKRVYQDDPAWIPPLRMEICDRLNPSKNPFFHHAEGMLFTAWRDGQIVGRCSAQIDREHIRVHNDGAGFFGFFDTLDDQEAASALLRSAESWLRARNMKRMRGPLSWSINEEVGLLVEGFEHPPVLLMSHSRPYQGQLVEKAGLAKIKDLYAWKYDVESLPPRAERAWQQIRELPEVRFRSVRKSDMAQELKGIMEIFNDAWKDNWGFVPATEAEIKKTAQDLKLLIDEDLAFVAEIDGRVMAMCICLPNLNEAIHDLNGRLFPLGFVKLLWRLKVKKIKSARLMLLGIRDELRGVKRYGALSTAMYAELVRRGQAAGYDWAELSWTLEDNRLINLGIKSMGAAIYKKYRVYEKELA